MKKTLITVSLIMVVCLSFIGGKYYSDKQNINSKNQRCNTYISFAIDNIEKLNSNDDDDILRVLISDIYAAKEYTTNNELNSALHELWNALIFDDDNLEGREDELIEALKNYDNNPDKIKDIAISMRSKS